MALSGSISKNVGSHWRLRLEWTATQNITANTSTVTAKLYWMATDGYGAVYSSATKTSGIKYNSNSWSNESATAKLNGNQKRLINTHIFTISHNDDGTASFSLDGYFDAEVTLSGTYYGTINLDAETFTLNTIPRKSSLKYTPNWTAGSNFTLTINRASSSFTHDITIYVNGTAIKTINGVGGSVSSGFTQSENTAIFTQLSQASSKATSVKVVTKKGSTTIGTNTYYGTCTAPTASVISTSNRSLYVDDSLTLAVSRKNSGFTHKMVITCGSFSKTINGIGTSTTFTPSSSEQNTLYGVMSTVKTKSGTITLTTYYNGIVVRSATSKSITFNIRNSNPTFGNGYTYADINNTTLAITGNSLKIVQNRSKVRVTLPVSSMATANNRATMVSYVATLGGKSITKNHGTSNITFDFEEINASSDAKLSIKAIDSRGNSTTTSKTVSIIPYQVPIIVSSAKRNNSFETTTKVSARGSISVVTGTQQNSVRNLDFRYKLASDGASGWSNWSPIAFTTTTANNIISFVSSFGIVELLDTSDYDVEVRVEDIFGYAYSTNKVLVGKPIFFIDAVRRSLGFNNFPVNNDEFRFNGKLIFGGSPVWQGSTGEGYGAIDLNNSDITGVNAIYFNDVSDSSSEGLRFRKSGATEDYDTLKVIDGAIQLNDFTVVSTASTNNNTVFQSKTGYVCVRAGSGIVYLQGTKVVLSEPSTPTSYIDIQGGLAYFNALDVNTGTHVYVRPKSDGSVKITTKGTTDTYRPVYASAFNNGSLEDYKQDISNMEIDACELISKAKLQRYRLKDEVANGENYMHYGFVINDKNTYNVPECVLSNDKKAVDSYSHSTLNTKAIQELIEEIAQLRAEIQELKQK